MNQMDYLKQFIIESRHLTTLVFNFVASVYLKQPNIDTFIEKVASLLRIRCVGNIVQSHAFVLLEIDAGLDK